MLWSCWNAPEGELTHDETALRGREARWAEYVIANPSLALRPGENVLAIHALNATITNTDFSIDAEIFVPSAADLEGDQQCGER